MNDEIKRDILVRHLVKCGCTNVVGGTLTINGTAYVAAKYEQDGKPTRIYAIGERPKCYVKRRATCFRFDDAADWYVAAYMPRENINTRNCDFHPLGANFLLSRWDLPSGVAIDAHNYWRGEHKPYTRVRAEFK